MITPQYIYRAKVTAIVDGDTLKLDIDLGLNTWVRNQVIRLLNVLAPELPTDAGKKAKDGLALLLPIGTDCVIQTVKDRKEKWGRWLGTIYCNDRNINDLINEALRAT